MMIGKKGVQQILLMAILLCSNQASLPQTNMAEGDILDFMPAIIAAAKRQRQAPPPLKPQPPIPNPPVNGLGNFRIAKTEIFNRLQPAGKMSTFVLTWNSSGNQIRDDLTIFNLFGGDPTQINHTVVANTTYDGQNRPRSKSYTTAYTNGNQDVGMKQYRYQGGRLHSTVSQSTFNSVATGSITTNSNMVFKYGGGNRLVGSTVIVNQPRNSISTTEQHTVSYDSNNRVRSHEMVRTNNIDNSLDKDVHTHRYDSAGNLVESVTIAATNLRVTKTYGAIIGNKSTGRIRVVNQATGDVLSDNTIVGTYEAGVCTLRGPNDPFVIEANITASVPYSPNVGCIKR